MARTDSQPPHLYRSEFNHCVPPYHGSVTVPLFEFSPRANTAHSSNTLQHRALPATASNTMASPSTGEELAALIDAKGLEIRELKSAGTSKDDLVRDTHLAVCGSRTNSLLCANERRRRLQDRRQFSPHAQRCFEWHPSVFCGIFVLSTATEHPVRGVHIDNIWREKSKTGAKNGPSDPRDAVYHPFSLRIASPRCSFPACVIFARGSKKCATRCCFSGKQLGGTVSESQKSHACIP